ncbi:carbohydrate ABC transporter permease [Dictyobacter aurantiacus]|uniref:ABC transporter permease n=1 Tax=Dictyobacter aurantiacus TaxID=1936993 RepID=A0A401ZRB3_9CHLR|nr:sugar ABC transporter permease [Dictyobacter aurantiacus]GCE09403.1 ABC transporter permease [Dictyobacter aurantiacus]
MNTPLSLEVTPEETRTSSDPRRQIRRRTSSSSWIGYLFIAPNFLGFAIFTLLPLLFSLVIAFARWDIVSGTGGITWVGLTNFSNLLQDPNFWESVRTTLIYVGASLPLSLLLGLLIALALNGPIPGRGILRVAFFIPYFANTVAIATVWLLLYHPTAGPINVVLKNLGVSNPPGWIISSEWALPALIMLAVWSSAGYNSIIYLAALQDVPQELYDAARIDGANNWMRFYYVALPFLRPSIFFLFVTGFISSSQGFGLINLMTQGGPGHATTVASYYIYQNAFQFYRYGYASAMAWVMFLLVFVLTLVFWFSQQRRSPSA